MCKGVRMKRPNDSMLLPGIIALTMLFITLAAVPSITLAQDNGVITYKTAGKQRIHAFFKCGFSLCERYWNGNEWEWQRAFNILCQLS